MRMLVAASRPARFRPVLTLVLVTLALIVGWVGLEVYFAFSVRPGPKGAWARQYQSHVESLSQPDPNGWEFFKSVLGVHTEARTRLLASDSPFSIASSPSIGHIREGFWLIEPESGMLDAYFDSMTSADMSRDEARAIWDESSALYQEWIRDFTSGPAWDRVTQLRTVTFAAPAIESIQDSWHAVYELSMPARNAHYTLRSSMVLARLAQDWQRYTESYEASLAIGWCLGSQPLLIGRLTGQSILRSTNAEAMRAADEGVLPNIVIARMQTIRQRWSLPAREYTIEGERMLMLEGIDNMHDQRGRRIFGGQHAVARVHPGVYQTLKQEPWYVNVKSILYPRRDDVVREVNEIYTAIQWLHSHPLRDQLLQYHSVKFEPILVRADEDYVFQGVDSDASPMTYIHEDMNAISVDVAFALAKYRNDFGTLPSSLNELVPDYIDERPRDPFDPDGESLRYTADPATVSAYRTKMPYLLYSVGFDGIDDGGAPPEGAMSQALRPDFSGTDYILNDPDWR